MLANTFSHGMIRNYVVAFGTLFNNIKINRRASSGESASTIAVPLAYAPRQRYIERILEDPDLNKPVAMSLPRMSFEMVSMTYSTERKLNTMQRFVRPKTTANTKLDATYSPVPYDFTFQLSIYINNIEDGTHIVEQILPYFTPEFTLGLRGVTDLAIPMDLPIILNSVTMEDSYEGGFDDRRIIIWTMDFTLKGNLYGPISATGLINKMLVNFHTSTDTTITNNYEQMITRPGQFANGVATNTAALSIAPNMINANSDFGIAQDIFNVGSNTSVFKYWNFENSSTDKVGFGIYTGNTTVDGWQTAERIANGTSTLSSHDGFLRHTIVKDNAGVPVTDIQEYAILQIFANTAGAGSFEPFYGKNYRTVTLSYRVAQTNGSGALISPQGEIRWLTSNAGEDQSFSTTDSTGTTSRFNRTTTSGHPAGASAVSAATGTYTFTWDMTKYYNTSDTITDWEDRIITALEFEVHAVEDSSGESTIVTDFDYIKIST